VIPVRAVRSVRVTVVRARNQGLATRQLGNRLSEAEVLVEGQIPGGSHYDDAPRTQEVERHLSAPVERHLRLLHQVAAVRDAQDRQA